MPIFPCEDMAKHWARIIAAKLDITDKEAIKRLEEYYRKKCEEKTEENWKSKLKAIAGVT